MKLIKEWSIKAPWGQIALASWGNPKGKPILLLHGRQDSVSTFIPLLKYLPEYYHYVGMDFPGHGRSDPFPTGVKLMRLHFVTPIDVVIQHLGWKKFVVISHSMGGELALFYNVIRPKRIIKFIHLDIGPALRAMTYDITPKMYEDFYQSYYENYDKENSDDRIYTKKRAMEAVKNARDLTEEQAELVLSRNLIPVGDDQYKMSWGRRLKLASMHFLPIEYMEQLFSNLPPSLFLQASLTIELKSPTTEFVRNLKNCKYEIVDGGHDVHLTNPEKVAGLVNGFLKKESGRSKL